MNDREHHFVYRPEQLDLRNDEDRARFDELRDEAGRGAVALIDTVDAQLQEYERLVLPAGARPAEEPTTRWVYFPWRRTGVHLLAPPYFDLVRLDRNRNKITREEQRRLRTLTVTVVGLSVGHVISHCIAMEGLCGRLLLADFDTIGLSNLNRVPATVLDLNLNKAVVTARRIAELDPYVDVHVEMSGATDDTMDGLLRGADVLIEECDSLDVKLRLRLLARQLGVPVLMETSDRGLLDVERFDLEPDRPLLHGLLAIAPDELAGLSTEEKRPHVMRLLEGSQLSSRIAASLVEIDRTLSTWPQLGGDVTLGAATIAAALRRLARGDVLPSGRCRIDLDAHLAELRQPPLPTAVQVAPGGAIEVAGPLPQQMAVAGSLAPSGGNSQPWRFRFVDPVMEIWVDPDRTRNRLDVGRRAAFMAIGAAAENMRIVTANAGQATSVVPFPTSDGDLVAKVVPSQGAEDEVGTLMRLFPTIGERCTNRRRYSAAPLREEHVSALSTAGESLGARCSFLLGPSVIARYAKLVGESDRIRLLSPELHSDLMDELRFPDADRATWDEAIAVETLEPTPDDLAKLELLRRADVMAHLRTWGLGSALADAGRELIEASAAVCAISIAGRDNADFVRGGQALQRVWLTATEFEIAVQPVSPAWLAARCEPDLGGIFPEEFVDQVRALDADMEELFGLGDDALVLVLRLGYAPPPTARSGRRPVTLETP